MQPSWNQKLKISGIEKMTEKKTDFYANDKALYRDYFTEKFSSGFL